MGRIHTINYRSISAGPLERTEVFFQGCNRKCPGCFSPETHDYQGGHEMTVEQLLEATLPKFDVLGFPTRLSICGGEPFDQPQFLLKYLKAYRSAAPNVTILAYSGYSYNNLRAMGQHECLQLINMLVVGSYIQELNIMGNPRHFIGSSNQELLFLSNGEPILHVDAIAANACASLDERAEQMEGMASLLRVLTL